MDVEDLQLSLLQSALKVEEEEVDLQWSLFLMNRAVSWLLLLYTLFAYAISAFAFYDFLQSWQVVRQEAQGRCYDGRRWPENNPEAAEFEVRSEVPSVFSQVPPDATTWAERHQIPELLCHFPVTVYLCPQPSFEECEDEKKLPVFQRSRIARTGVFCWGALGFTMLDTHRCADPVWTCTSTGNCSGYEKSKRRCAAELRREAYPCFFDPDNPAVLIKDKRYTSHGHGEDFWFCFPQALFGSFLLLYFARVWNFFVDYGDAKLVCSIGLGFLLVSLLLDFVLVPGEGYYSLLGAPQLAAPQSVRLSDFHHQEAPVPAGFNQPSLAANEERNFVLMLEAFWALVVIACCFCLGSLAWGDPSDSYQRMSP